MKIKNINTGFVFDLSKEDALSLLKSQPYDFENLEKVKIKEEKTEQNLTKEEKQILGISDKKEEKTEQKAMNYDEMKDFVKKHNIKVENLKKETLISAIENYLKDSNNEDISTKDE